MNHMPYQGWIFEDRQTLDKADISALQSHLAVCAECSALAEDLQQVEQVLRAQPLQGPTEGFTLRWQARLEAERSRQHRRQVGLALMIGLSGALTLLTLLAVLFWPALDSLDALLWAAAYQLYIALAFARQAVGIVGEFVRYLAPALPLVFWVFALGLLTQACVLWVVSYRYMTNPRRIEI